MLVEEDFLDFHVVSRHVESLPEWDENRDDDPNWLIPAMRFGWVNPLLMDGGKKYLDYCKSLDITFDQIIEIDPYANLYSGQKHIRLDAVYHYLSFDDLFDQEGFFDNDHPVITEWADGYAVFDGHHRITAARILNRPIKVYLVSQKKLTP